MTKKQLEKRLMKLDEVVALFKKDYREADESCGATHAWLQFVHNAAVVLEEPDVEELHDIMENGL